MDEPYLAARPAWAGLDLPLAHGGVTLAALPDAPLTALAPFRGRGPAIAAILGVPLPEPGRLSASAHGRVIWCGIDRYLLEGDPDPRLAEHAALADQSDGWTGLALSGAGARDALARLVPLDLDPAVFPTGAVARSALRHVDCLLIAELQGFEIRVGRSFTRSAVDDIGTAMRAVAARG